MCLFCESSGAYNSWVANTEACAMAKRAVYFDTATGRRPVRNSKSVVIGRGGEERRLRCYHLSPEQIAAYRARIAAEGHFVSPYCAVRMHSTIVRAFVACGTNVVHPVHVVFDAFRGLMNDPSTIRNGKTAWQRYDAKRPRNEATHLAAFPRFLQTLEFLQRLGGNHPIGLKLAQLGACIDILRANDGMLQVRLRTDIPVGSSVQPINENRVRKYTKTVTSVPSGYILPH